MYNFKSLSRNFSFSAFYVAFWLLMVLQPYFVWSLFDTNISILFNIIFFIILIPHIDIKTINKILLSVYFLGLALYASYVRSVTFSSMCFLMLLLFIVLLNGKYIVRYYEYFVRLFSIVILISLLMWLLILVGVSIPYNIVDPLNYLKSYNYKIYPMLVVPNFIGGITRFHSVFDEPGVVGTLCLLLLFIEKFNLKKWYNIILFVGGICSFSLAFFIGSLLYFVSIFIFSKQNKKGIWLIIVLSLFFVVSKNIPIFDSLIYSRMKWDSINMQLSGDNRSNEEQKNYFNQITGTSDFWFGDKGLKTRGLFEGRMGFRNAVIAYGMIFCILYFVFFLLLAKSYKLTRSQKILFSILFLSVFYQRPNVMHITYLFLYTSFIVIHSSLDLRERKFIING